MFLWWRLFRRLFKPKHHWLQRTKAQHGDAYRSVFFDEFGIWPEDHARWVEKRYVSDAKQRRLSGFSRKFPPPGILRKNKWFSPPPAVSKPFPFLKKNGGAAKQLAARGG